MISLAMAPRTAKLAEGEAARSQPGVGEAAEGPGGDACWSASCTCTAIVVEAAGGGSSRPLMETKTSR